MTTQRILLVEPDMAGRTLMDRVLRSEGCHPIAVASVSEAKIYLDSGMVRLAVVDEAAGPGALLDEVRLLRERYPATPLVVIGTLFSQRVLLELLRLGVLDALPKPFTPEELRDIVHRTLARSVMYHCEALEYAAAIAAAKNALFRGQLAQVPMALVRAYTACPLDSDIMILQAVLAELTGRDSEADHAYRASLALRCDESSGPSDPYAGLARLRAYGDALPVYDLGSAYGGRPVWIITDPEQELCEGPPQGVEAGPIIIMMGLGLATDQAQAGALFFRKGSDPNAYLLIAGIPRLETIVSACSAFAPRSFLALPPTAKVIDLERLEDLCAKDHEQAVTHPS